MVALSCTLGLTIPAPAHAGIIVSTIEFVRKLFQIEDMTHTDWKQVSKDLGEDLDPKKIMKAINEPLPQKKATTADNKNTKAVDPHKQPEPQPKVRPAQYLVISLFIFFLIISSILMLWMATRR